MLPTSAAGKREWLASEFLQKRRERFQGSWLQLSSRPGTGGGGGGELCLEHPKLGAHRGWG